MTSARRPGQPLAALALLVGGWILARLVVWQAPVPLGEALAMPDLVARSPASGEASRTDATSALASVTAPLSQLPAPVSADAAAPNSLSPLIGGLTSAPVQAALAPDIPRRTAAAAAAVDPSSAAADRPSPAFLPPRPIETFAVPGRGPATLAPWSGESWLLLRAGAAGALAAQPGTGRYGGSQAGAALRYRLGSGDHRPTLYARTSAALAGDAERELALGAAVRPLASVPVRAQLELRGVQVGGRLRLRPAAFAVSELPPLELPGQLTAQAYLQAGYVAGDFATPFVGGDLRIDRPVAELGEARIRIGAGAWGGAQKDAAAFDIGPGATLETRFGGVPAKLALDYRRRVAGAAEPRSGLALTLTAGF